MNGAGTKKSGGSLHFLLGCAYGLLPCWICRHPQFLGGRIAFHFVLAERVTWRRHLRKEDADGSAAWSTRQTLNLSS